MAYFQDPFYEDSNSYFHKQSVLDDGFVDFGEPTLNFSSDVLHNPNVNVHPSDMLRSSKVINIGRSLEFDNLLKPCDMEADPNSMTNSDFSTPNDSERDDSHNFSSESTGEEDDFFATGGANSGSSSDEADMEVYNSISSSGSSSLKEADSSSRPARTKPAVVSDKPASPVEVLLPRETLLAMTTVEIEEYITMVKKQKILSEEDEKELRKQRRLVKNREYAQNARKEKKMAHVNVVGTLESLKSENEALKEANRKLEEQNRRLLSRLGESSVLSQSTVSKMLSVQPVGRKRGRPPKNITTSTVLLLALAVGLYVGISSEVGYSVQQLDGKDLSEFDQLSVVDSDASAVWTSRSLLSTSEGDDSCEEPSPDYMKAMSSDAMQELLYSSDSSNSSEKYVDPAATVSVPSLKNISAPMLAHPHLTQVLDSVILSEMPSVKNFALSRVEYS